MAIVSPSPSTQPLSVSAVEALWENATRVAIIGIFLMLFAAMLDQARTLLVPFVSAAVLALVLGPLASTSRQWGVPSWLFAALVIVFVLAALNAAIIPASAFVIDWIARAPDIWATIMAKLRPMLGPFEALREMREVQSQGGAGVLIDVADLAKSTLTFLTPTVGEMIVFLAALFFLLTGRTELRRYLVLLFEDQETRLRTLRILNNIESDLKRYVATVTTINSVFGVLVAVIAQVVGLPKAPLWGALAFVLKFIPYLGPVAIFTTLLIGGLTIFDSLVQALFAPFAFIVLDTLETYVVTPSIVGKQLTLSPGLVFVAVAFWAWLWGPIGAFLATPLLIAAAVTINHVFPKHEVDLPS